MTDLAPLYQRLEPNPDAEYGGILPFARNRVGSASWVQEGDNLRFALPAIVRDGLRGYLDLANSTQTGSLTPEALQAMTLGSLGAGVSMAPRGALAAGGAKTHLPMDQASRYERAAQQGYTIDAYKGAYPYDYRTGPWTKGFTVMDADKVPQPLTSLNSPHQPYAAFLSDSPDVASRFGSLFSPGSVFPTKLKFSNPLVIDAGGKPSAAFQFPDIAKKYGTSEHVDAFKGAFREGSPHDGVIIKNTSDEGTVFIPRAPEQIRSRFAAFDPAQANSPDLLAAYGIPAPLAVPVETNSGQPTSVQREAMSRGLF